MKKIIFVLSVSLFLLFLCFGLSSCSTLDGVVQAPNVTFNSVNIAGIGLQGVDLIVRINVENPNAFNIPFPEVNWHMFINDNSFVRGMINEGTNLRGRRTVTVDLPISVSYSGFFNSFASLFGSSEVGYKVALDLRFPLPVINDLTYNLEFEGILPLLQIPRLSAPSFRTGRMDFTGIEQIWAINIANPNNFSIPIPEYNWQYEVNGTPVIRGKINQEGELAALSENAVNFTVNMRYADIISAIGSLGNAPELRSLMNMDTILPFDLPDGLLSPFQFPATIPILHPPALSLRGINIRNMALQNLEFIINWEIENRNSFPMSITDFNYNLSVNGSEWVRGVINNVPDVRPNSRVVIPVDLTITSVNTISQIIDILNRGSTVNYTSDVNFNMSGATGMGTSRWPYNLAGTTRLTRL